SFAPLVKRAAPTVVNIYTKRVVESRGIRSPFADDPFFRRFFGEEFLGSPLPRRRIENSLGSGVIVGADGLIVTNNHVIKGSDAITVVLADRREFAAELVLADERTDLAALRIALKDEKLPTLELMDSDDLEVGDLVLAIGNPFGVGQTVTSGIVSALARTQVGITDFRSFIQTDAAVNPGNSGGALVTMDGRLAGINTAIFSQSGGSIGIGFAVPANMVAVIVRAAAAGGKIVRPWFGAGGQAVTHELATTMGLGRPGGVLINSVYRGGPAEQAGLKVGDVLRAVDGKPVEDPEQLRFRFATRAVGGTAKLSVQRAGGAMDLKIALRAPPENPPREATALAGASPLAGATVANMSPALAEEIGIDAQGRGVIVLGVAANSPAAAIRLRPGDLIRQINGRDVADVAQVRAAVRTETTRWRLQIQRGEQVTTLDIGR
ncbi:MAG: Do family serine endopeptidase, partial [Alphaproteobacteria bacterium]|nr:Do family serine endopeptidase [Alphaproteobacteria bacterium]